MLPLVTAPTEQVGATTVGKSALLLLKLFFFSRFVEVEDQDASSPQGGAGVAGEGGGGGGEDQEQEPGEEAGGHSQGMAGKQVIISLRCRIG